MMIKNKIIILIIFTSFLIPNKLKNTSINRDQRKIINQANSLRKNGLIEESLTVYYNLFNKSPYLYEVYKPLKSILIKQNDLNKLMEISNKFLIANNNNIKAQVEVLEAYLLKEDISKCNNILSNLKNIFPSNEKDLNRALKILLNNNKETIVIKTLTEVRDIKPDYFSLELGLHYSINLSIEKSLDEFFKHMQYNPNKRDFIFNRILAFPNMNFIDVKIKEYLSQSEHINSKILLSKIEFKNKNFEKAYELLSNFNEGEQSYIKFVDDLIKIKQYEFAQKVINDIFTMNFSEDSLEKSIFQLAQIFENKIINDLDENLLINDITQNQLLNSPFVKINNDKNSLLFKAISIYDSLSINTNKVKPLFHLAEIKYKILADFDGSKKLYEKILSYKNHDYYIPSIERKVDIMISEGNLDGALDFIIELEKIENKDLNTLIGFKKIQILYYKYEIEKLKAQINYIIKKAPQNFIYYNDILSIKHDILLFSEDTNFQNYSLAMLKVFQNKRTEAINILESLLEIDNEQISNKIKFECAYLYFLQDEFVKSIEIINNISNNSSFFEQGALLKAEIYDYKINNKSIAADLYMDFLNKFPLSIYYESIRIRLRELAG